MSKTVKKMMMIVLSAVMVLALAACGGGSSSDSEGGKLAAIQEKGKIDQLSLPDFYRYNHSHP